MVVMIKNKFQCGVIVSVLAILLSLLSGCGNTTGESGSTSTVKKKSDVDVLTFAAYTVPREAYQDKIIPAFKAYWKQKTGRTVSFRESYNASGAQSRAVAAGLEADVVALSLEKDIMRLVDAGLIGQDWKKSKYNGFVTRSTVVLVLRPDSSFKITGWEDLAKGDVQLIYPSPKTSGGAMWVVNAIYGAGLKISEKREGKQNPDFARRLLKEIQSRVKVMDKSGRASVTTFENGFGDVLLTYENEALLRKKQGKDFPFVLPESTILIQNPIAVVDKNVAKHDSREVAEAFVDFILSEESQRWFARYGFRPVDDTVLAEFQATYPVPPMLFDIDFLGGWDKVNTDFYGPQGIWTEIIAELGAGR